MQISIYTRLFFVLCIKERLSSDGVYMKFFVVTWVALYTFCSPHAYGSDQGLERLRDSVLIKNFNATPAGLEDLFTQSDMLSKKTLPSERKDLDRYLHDLQITFDKFMATGDYILLSTPPYIRSKKTKPDSLMHAKIVRHMHALQCQCAVVIDAIHGTKRKME